MRFQPPCDCFVLTGESSGDAYAGAIVERVKRHHGDVVVAAMGGAELAAAGAEIEQDIAELDVMGFIDVARRLPQFLALRRRIASVVRARRPKVVLSVDYPGFNLRLHRDLADLRAAGTRLIHVVAPQVWAWRPRRAKKIAATVDRLLCFFPFEPPLFRRHGGDAEFVGHPLPDLIGHRFDTAFLDRAHGWRADAPVLLLAPGSRASEVRGLLPAFHEAAVALQRRRPEVQVVVAKADDLEREVYRAVTHFPLVEGRYRELCARAHCALIASGTATLEAALIGLPHIIAYRTDHATATVMRHLLIAPHIGLPNIVLGERAVPELLQHEVAPPRLLAHLLELWQGDRRDRCRAALSAVRQRLGGGAMDRIAAIVGEELQRGQRRSDTIDQRRQTRTTDD